MGGGIIQLVTMGGQDEHITGNPQITYFKSVYRRHTNFSMESVQQIINGTSITENTNTSGTVIISKSADLLSRVYVVCSDHINGINGSEVIDTVELIIGGKLIDKHTSEWMKVWNELTIPSSKRDGYLYMTGGFSMVSGSKPPVTNRSSIIVPLNFWFCRYPGLSLPLVALQYHDVSIKFKWGINFDINSDNDINRGTTCEVWCDYIYLDQDERKKFATTELEYLIDQVQIVDSSIEAPSMRYKMGSINHPIKEIIWLEGNTGTDLVTTEKFTILFNGLERFPEQYKEYFTIKQPMDHHTTIPGYNIKDNNQITMLEEPISLLSETEVGASIIAGNTPTSGEVSVQGNGTITFMTNTSPGTIYIGDILSLSYPSTTNYPSNHIVRVTSISQQWVNSNTVCNLTVNETSSHMADSAVGDASIYIIGRRINNRSRCSNLTKNIYVYSFSINPEEHQPSGVCNFSKLSDVKLAISTSITIDKIYAVNYNILKISNGMCNLFYTS